MFFIINPQFTKMRATLIIIVSLIWLLHLSWACQDNLQTINMYGKWSSTGELHLKVIMHYQNDCRRKKRFLPAIFWFLAVVFTGMATITAVAAQGDPPPTKKPKLHHTPPPNNGPLPPVFTKDEWYGYFSSLPVQSNYFILRTLKLNSTHQQKFYLLNANYQPAWLPPDDLRPNFIHNNYQENAQNTMLMSKELQEFVEAYARENNELRRVARTFNRQLVRVQRQGGDNIADRIQAIVRNYYYDAEPRFIRRRQLEIQTLRLRRRLFCTLQGVYLTEGLYNHLGSHRTQNLPFTLAIQLQDIVLPHERIWLNDITRYYNTDEPNIPTEAPTDPGNYDYDASSQFENQLYSEMNLPDDAFTNYNNFLSVNLDQPFYTLQNQPAKLFYLAALASIAKILRGVWNRPHLEKRDLEQANKHLKIRFCQYTFTSADYFYHLINAK